MMEEQYILMLISINVITGIFILGLSLGYALYSKKTQSRGKKHR